MQSLANYMLVHEGTSLGQSATVRVLPAIEICLAVVFETQDAVSTTEIFFSRAVERQRMIPFLSILVVYLLYCLSIIYLQKERVFSEHYECNWWKEMCRKLPPDTLLLALLLFSDAYVALHSLRSCSSSLSLHDLVLICCSSTQLTNFFGQDCHNVQLSMCNLPSHVQDLDDGSITLAFLPKLTSSIHCLCFVL